MSTAEPTPEEPRPCGSAVAVSVASCARCGGDHLLLPFRKFGRPIDDFTHWGTCPTTREPILLRFANT